MSNTNLKGIGLIRLSTQEQAEEGRAGIDRQKNDIQVAARMHGVTLIRVVEVIESGTKVRGQKDFQQIWRELESGAADGIVCSHLDRVTRPNSFEDYGIFQVFRANRRRIWTPAGAVEPWTQSGFMQCSMQGMFAGMERQLIVARTTAAKEVLRLRGWHPNGDQLLPRGVGCERIKEGRKTVGFRWFYQEPDASLVRRAYELLLTGQSYNAIAETIGHGWTGNGIRGAMLNSIWYGVRTFPPTADRKLPMERRVIPASEALIDFETWKKAQAIIAGRKKAWGARKRQPRFLASGMVYCPCGKPYYSKGNGRHDRTRQQEHYVCSSNYRGHGPKCGYSSLQRVGVDAAVVSVVKNTFRDPALLLRLVELSEQRTKTKADIAKLQTQLDRLEAKRQRLIDAYGEGTITKAEFQKRVDAVESDRRNIEALLPAKAPALDARRLVKAVVKYFAGFEHRPFEEQRQILRAAFRQFSVENGAIQNVTVNGGFLGSMDGAKVSRDCSA